MTRVPSMRRRHHRRKNYREAMRRAAKKQMSRQKEEYRAGLISDWRPGRKRDRRPPAAPEEVEITSAFGGLFAEEAVPLECDHVWVVAEDGSEKVCAACGLDEPIGEVWPYRYHFLRGD